MKKYIISAVLSVLATGAMAELSNDEYCQEASAKGKLNGLPIKMCICMQEQMDEHMSEEMIENVNNIQMTGEVDQAKFQALAAKPGFSESMQAYGAAVSGKCLEN